MKKFILLVLCSVAFLASCSSDGDERVLDKIEPSISDVIRTAFDQSPSQTATINIMYNTETGESRISYTEENYDTSVLTKNTNSYYHEKN